MVTRRIIIADARPLERLGIAAVVAKAFPRPRLTVADTYGELVGLLHEHPFDMAAVDLDLPGLCSMGDLRRIRVQYPEVLLTAISSGTCRNQALQALGAGVHGVIVENMRQEEMVQALRKIVGGMIFVPREVCEVGGTVDPSLDGQSFRPVRQLSERQRDVLRLAAEGNSNKEIARKLEIAEATVKVHISAAFRAMGVHNRTRAAAAFLERYGAQGQLMLG